MIEKLFSGVYVRTFYTFSIPELLSKPKNVHSAFQTEKLIDRLKDLKSPEKNLEFFSKIVPVYNFKKSVPSDYQEYFWKQFWGQEGNDFATHFPFRCTLEDKPIRLLSLQNSTRLRNYHSKLKGRIFPYGVISLQLIEYFRYADGISSTDIIEFLDSPIAWNNSTYKIKEFWSIIKNNILNSMLSKAENFPIETAKPYFVIHPEFNTKSENIDDIINLDSNWTDIAMLLAMSTNSRYYGKYSQDSIVNTSKYETQKIFSSPFSSIILASDFETPFQGKKCLRNRISNISELVIIQNLMAKQYCDTIKRLIQELNLQQSFDGLTVKRYLWKRMNKNQFFALSKIFEFQKAIENEQWLKWYISIGSHQSENITKLVTALEDFQKINDDVGKNAKGAIKGFTDYIIKLAEPIKTVAGLFQSSTK